MSKLWHEDEPAEAASDSSLAEACGVKRHLLAFIVTFLTVFALGLLILMSSGCVQQPKPVMVEWGAIYDN